MINCNSRPCVKKHTWLKDPAHQDRWPPWMTLNCCKSEFSWILRDYEDLGGNYCYTNENRPILSRTEASISWPEMTIFELMRKYLANGRAATNTINLQYEIRILLTCCVDFFNRGTAVARLPFRLAQIGFLVAKKVSWVTAMYMYRVCLWSLNDKAIVSPAATQNVDWHLSQLSYAQYTPPTKLDSWVASAVCTHQSSVVTQFPIFCASHRLLRLVTP